MLPGGVCLATGFAVGRADEKAEGMFWVSVAKQIIGHSALAMLQNVWINNTGESLAIAEGPE